MFPISINVLEIDFKVAPFVRDHVTDHVGCDWRCLKTIWTRQIDDEADDDFVLQ